MRHARRSCSFTALAVVAGCHATNSPAPAPAQPTSVAIAPASVPAPPPSSAAGATSGAPDTASPPAFCIKPDLAGVDHAALAAATGALSFCVGAEGSATCASLDLATGGYTAAPPASPASPPSTPVGLRLSTDGAHSVVTSNAKVHVCDASGASCHDVAVAGFHPTALADRFGGSHIPADVTPDGKQLFLVRHEGDKSEKIFGETYDVPSGRRLARFPIDADELVTEVAWVGSKVYIQICVEEGPGCTEKLVDPASGAVDAGLDLNACCTVYSTYFHVKGDVWAFVDGSGSAMIWKDTRSGAVVRKLGLRPITDTGPGAAGLVRRADDLFIVYDASDAGEVWQVSLADGTIAHRWKPKACP